MKIPKPLANLINSFERLPGIGPKTAQRLTFHMLNFPQEDLEKFAQALVDLKKNTQFCKECKNISEDEICGVCGDYGRNSNIIAVVSSPLDVFALEKANFKGKYHVLHGVINPLDNIGPEELFIHDLLPRVKKTAEEEGEVEVILATNTSLEGESTAMYISKMLKEAHEIADKLKVTRIARGLPVGGDIEYADDITLSRALEGRSFF